MIPFLADADASRTLIYPVSDMNGVTTALVAFVFVCVVYPRLVKNKPQFYAGLACVIGIILLHTVGLMITSLAIFAAAIGALLQAVGILMLFLSAGGLSWKELAGELGNAYEVIRRGGETKEVIIPLTGARPKARARPAGAPTSGTNLGGAVEAPRERIVLDEPPEMPELSETDAPALTPTPPPAPALTPTPAPAPARRQRDTGQIPLD